MRRRRRRRNHQESKRKYKEQRLTRGWDDTELWSLDVTIAQFITPRLKRLAEVDKHEGTSRHTKEEWDEVMSKMIAAFEMLSKGDADLEDDYEKVVPPGLKLFAENFGLLWD